MRTVVAPSGYLRADGKEVVKSEGPTLSRRTSSLARKRPWLRAAATVGMALLLAVSLAIHAHWLWQLLATAGLVIASYVWGFSDRAFSRPLWPPLSHLHRRQYADVWNSLASSEKDAPIAAAGYADDDGLRRSAAQAVGNLLDLASLDAREDVLEIGCGVGRIGAELAAHCRSWTGADISAHMLAQACRRLRETPNARCVLLRGASLSEFADHTFDVVYATNMLAHLDEMDRWLYLKDAFRVLRPGGGICIDNVDIE
jgi:predicted O-methyltransferase YrrM